MGDTISAVGRDLVYFSCKSQYRRLGLSALVGTIATVYALHNEVRYILGVKG